MKSEEVLLDGGKLFLRKGNLLNKGESLRGSDDKGGKEKDDFNDL